MMQNTTPNMTEQELLNDLLNQEKQLIGAYSMGITECSCPNLRSVLTKQYTETCTDQFNVFEQMRQRGFYQTKDASDQDVTTAKQSMQQIHSQMQ